MSSRGLEEEMEEIKDKGNMMWMQSGILWGLNAMPVISMGIWRGTAFGTRRRLEEKGKVEKEDGVKEGSKGRVTLEEAKVEEKEKMGKVKGKARDPNAGLVEDGAISLTGVQEEKG